jgi:hypothetical protein
MFYDDWSTSVRQVFWNFSSLARAHKPVRNLRIAMSADADTWRRMDAGDLESTATTVLGILWK